MEGENLLSHVLDKSCAEADMPWHDFTEHRTKLF